MDIYNGLRMRYLRQFEVRRPRCLTSTEVRHLLYHKHGLSSSMFNVERLSIYLGNTLVLLFAIEGGRFQQNVLARFVPDNGPTFASVSGGSHSLLNVCQDDAGSDRPAATRNTGAVGNKVVTRQRQSGELALQKFGAGRPAAYTQTRAKRA